MQAQQRKMTMLIETYSKLISIRELTLLELLYLSSILTQSIHLMTKSTDTTDTAKVEIQKRRFWLEGIKS